MYKVFFNRTEFLIVEKGELVEVKTFYKEREVCDNLPDKELCLSYLDKDVEHSIIYSTNNLENDWVDFKKTFKLIAASGGLVENENGDLLVIFRNGVWDLPKGKVEKNESIELAASREVEEETGVKIYEQKMSSVQKVYHVYYHKSNLILKTTYWYDMLAKSMLLSPQTEEGITEVRWMSKSEIKKILVINTYPSIKKLLNF